MSKYDHLSSGELARRLEIAESELAHAKRVRRAEQEQHEALRDLGGAPMILRTLDGLMVFVGAKDAREMRGSRRVPYMLECVYRMCGRRAESSDDPALLRRLKIRKYVETDERICGIPVFNEEDLSP